MRIITRRNSDGRAQLDCGHLTATNKGFVVGRKWRCHACERLHRKVRRVPTTEIVCQDHQAEIAGVQIGRAPNGTLTLWICIDGQARLRITRLKSVQFTNLITGFEEVTER